MIALALRPHHIRILIVGLFMACFALPSFWPMSSDVAQAEETQLGEQKPRAYLPMLHLSARATATRVPNLATATPSAATPTPTPTPASTQLRGIYGLVNDTGKGAASVDVELMVTADDIDWTSVRVVRTDSRGYYSFADAPTLQAGAKYAVHYVNTGNPKRLDLWVTHRLISYTAGANINMGKFDIANVELESPANNATVTLPSTFKWKVRTGQSNEFYQLSVFTPPEGDVTDYISPRQTGSSFTLNTETLPPHYIPMLAYSWEVWVSEAEGQHTAAYEEGNGYGVSYEKRMVTFENLLMR
ncbi:MAG: hypothetical protein KIH69_014040 [Anaerolineae bacterium]|nr:hypothetical protein [Anaerolineae bacterium]